MKLKLTMSEKEHPSPIWDLDPPDLDGDLFIRQNGGLYIDRASALYLAEVLIRFSRRKPSRSK